MLSGEAGIGKTTLWLAGIDAATDRGYRILSVSTLGRETRFSFAGLSDLLDGVGHVVAELPPIQRRALEAALLLGEAEIDADDRAVAAAFLAALRRLAAESPIASRSTTFSGWTRRRSRRFGYALARLEREPVAALLAVRGEVPDWLRRAVPEDRLRTVDVTGLSLGATHELLHARLDATFPRPALIKLWETSRGNPFFALELARRSSAEAERLLPARSSRSRRASTSSCTRASTASARGAGRRAGSRGAGRPDSHAPGGGTRRPLRPGLAETLDARILELDGERVRFTHPLLGSAVVGRQTPGRRQALHARLADVVPSPEERARHLALATAEPSRESASILEDAARSAQARGAPATAAELAEQALRLTPTTSPDDARRRVLTAADMHYHAGTAPERGPCSSRCVPELQHGNERATIVTHLAGVQASPQDAVALYREALSEAEGDDALEATIHLRLAATHALHRRDRGRDGTRKSWPSAPPRAWTMPPCAAVHSRLTVSCTSTLDAASPPLRWRRRSHSSDRWRTGRSTTVRRGSPHGSSAGRRTSTARAVSFRRSCPSSRRATIPAGEAEALWYLSLLETRAANWDEAERYATGALDLRTQLDRVIPPHHFPAAIIDAHRGRIEEARARSQGAVAHAEAKGIGIGTSGHSWVLGFLELSPGDAAGRFRT